MTFFTIRAGRADFFTTRAAFFGVRATFFTPRARLAAFAAIVSLLSLPIITYGDQVCQEKMKVHLRLDSEATLPKDKASINLEEEGVGMRSTAVHGGKQWERKWIVMVLLFLSLFITAIVGNAQAPAPTTDPAKKTAKAEKPATYTSAILLEPETGKILFEKDAHTPLPPASMVKMMTALIVMEKVREGALRLDDKVTPSRWAAQMGGSQVYLKEGETMTVEDLLKAMMIHSANDATAALAEHVAGSGDACIDLMNQRAESLGLKETRYHSVHGRSAELGQAGND